MSQIGIRRILQNGIDIGHPVASALRWPRWLLACSTGKPVIAKFRTEGLQMHLVPKLHSFGTTSIYIKRDYYEPELLASRHCIEPGSVVLDIGSSYGIYALFMATFVGPNGKVHCFEPGAFSFSQLAMNVKLNRFEERTTLHNVAASDTTATLKLHYIEDSPVNFSIGAADGTESEEVDAVRVADQVPEPDASRVSFIKIDVEGYEVAALEGARPILERQKPVIMFEVSAAALSRQGQVPADIYDYLASFGYKFWSFRDGEFAPVVEPLEGNIFASETNLSIRNA